LLDISAGKIGVEKHHHIDHFEANDKQDGMICLGCAPDAERVPKMNYRKRRCADVLKNCAPSIPAPHFSPYVKESRIKDFQRKMQRLQSL
jgi:hypothetical protein